MNPLVLVFVFALLSGFARFWTDLGHELVR